jgi:putative transposase
MMSYPQRKQLRLRGYDYRKGGAYFCTMCVHRAHRRKELFAVIHDGALHLNRFGAIVEQCWEEWGHKTEGVILDAFVVMPNHVHLVLLIEAPERSEPFAAQFGRPPAGSLGEHMRAFKSSVTHAISEARGVRTLVWQPRFYDRIIRDERELENVRRYIADNPTNWLADRCHPQHPEFELAWQGTDPDAQM